jgi:hypothetical protein
VDESAASVRGDGGPGFLEVLDDGVLFNETKNPWLGIPILDSVPWDGRNSEFRFRVPEPRTFRRKLKSENLKTPLVENRNSGSYFSGIPEFRL